MPSMKALSVRLGCLVAALLVAACGGGGSSDGRFAFTLELLGFPDGSQATGHFQGWAVVDGVPVSTGRFRVMGTGPTAEVRSVPGDRLLGTAAGATFGPSSTLLGEDFPFIADAEEFFITWESEGDRDDVPSCVVLLAGRLVDDQATLTPEGVGVPMGFPCAVPAGAGFRLGFPDLGPVQGTFQMRSFTNDVTSPTPDDHAGVWFVRDADTPSGFECGLDLPVAPEGMIYEAFAVVDGVTRSLGRFRDPEARDRDASVALQRGPDGPGPECPGQDFVTAFMPAFAFDPPALELSADAVDVQGDYDVFVTVEPVPDNAPEPFQLRLLQTRIPPDLVVNGFSSATTALTSLAADLPTAEVTRSGSTLTLENIGLEDLGAGSSDRRGHYRLWIGTATETMGVASFVIDGESVVAPGGGTVFGTRDAATFMVAPLAGEDRVFVSFEDEGDADDEPDRVLLGGLLQGGSALLTVAGLTPSGGLGLADFVGVNGTFRLATPTDDDEGPANAGMGILFGSVGAPGLVLPTLPTTWRYEAFIREVATGRVFSTGTFARADRVDDSDADSRSRGPEAKPALPGEDFVMAVPTAALMPAGPGSITRVFVTLSLEPDAFAGPSPLVILDALVPGSAVSGGVGGIDVPMTPVPITSATLAAQLEIDD